MSHRPSWDCSKCRHQLGEVVSGALLVWAAGPLIGPESTAVNCPRCGTTNVWHHKVETTAR